MSNGFLVVVGASTGGIHALMEIAAALPARFPAPVCIVQHVGNHPSLLPELLARSGPNPAKHARDGEELVAGTLYIAPPDHHMLVYRGRALIHRGPKENHTRPAIDPLLRSAATEWGPGTIGVVLTGQLDDGTAGLRAVKECGGLAVVQDPRDAVEPDMPLSALRNVDVDHCVPLRAIAGLLCELVADSLAPAAQAPVHVAREAAINRGDMAMDNLQALAEPSPLTCPDCGGSLWEMRGEYPPRFRCHIGHGYTAATLERAQVQSTDFALQNTVRSMRERELLLRRLAGIAEATGDAAQAGAGRAEADRVRRRIDELRAMSEADVGSAP